MVPRRREMAACFCYMTAGSRDEALRIARALVEERLAACANLLEGMTSVYRWQGRIEEDDEVVLIAKTRDDLVDRLVERVKALHSYDCPCVVALPITDGNPEFIAWIGAETEDA
jgi:periplasmic divalent cation tolerance protein